MDDQRTGVKTRLSRRDALKLGLAGAGCLAVGGSTATEARAESGTRTAQAKPPINVVFINTDQQRFDALSCAGSPYVSTPNLDRLAAQGVRFTHAFTPQPECVPARTAFHTGLTVFKSGCTVNTEMGSKSLRLGSGSFEQNLTKLGYASEYHGRWHAALPLTDCYRNKVTPKFQEHYQNYLKEVRGVAPPVGPGQVKSFISGWPYAPDLTTEQLGDSKHKEFNIQYGIYSLPTDHTFTGFTCTATIDAIKRLKDEPFAVSAGILAPHHPWYVPQPFADSIDPEKMDLPLTMHDTRQNTPYVKSGWQLDEVEEKHMKLFRARYYELVAEADHHVGRVMRALDQLGLADNTLLVFCADHGEMLGEHGLTQKFVPYQPSIRVPMIMRLPGAIRPGTVVDQPVNTIDIFSTIFDYLGQPCPENDGQSLRPLIEGRGGRSEYTFCELGWQNIPYTVMVSREWKYVWTHRPDAVDMLYDLQKDPNELNNLLGSNPERGKHLAKAREIRKHMLGWMESIQHPRRDMLAESEVG